MRKNPNMLVSKSFNNFWHLIYTDKHKNSKIHVDCMKKWKELLLQLHLHQKIDNKMQNLMDKQRKNRELVWKASLASLFF